MNHGKDRFMELQVYQRATTESETRFPVGGNGTERICSQVARERLTSLLAGNRNEIGLPHSTFKVFTQ